jgi:hypothetical protein
MFTGLRMLALAGCSAWAIMGRNSIPGRNESAGPPTAQQRFWPLQPVKPWSANVMLTSAAYFLKIPFLFCLKIPENVFNL